MFGNTAEYVQKYTSKGSRILVEGRLNTRSYDDKEGNKRQVTEVIVDKVELIGTKKENAQNNQETVQNSELNAQNNQNIVQNVGSNPFIEFGEEVRIDDNFLE